MQCVPLKHVPSLFGIMHDVGVKYVPYSCTCSVCNCTINVMYYVECVLVSL